MIRVGCLLPVLAWCGCATVEVGVSNPVPGLSRVAVVPFFNMSSEPSADGRRFAEAYFTELQKTPGFEVLPIGVAEVAVRENGLNMNSPEDALKLARILDVDAVVLGAITAYDPYYPPRLGLRVSWYSPYDWHFAPGIPTDPHARPPAVAIPIPALPTFDGCFEGGEGADIPPRGRLGQLPRNRRGRHPGNTAGDGTDGASRDGTGRYHSIHDGMGRDGTGCVDPEQFPEELIEPGQACGSGGGEGAVLCEPAVRGQSPDTAAVEAPLGPPVEPPLLFVPDVPPPGFGGIRPFDPRRPLMSYARVFDGADSNLTAALRDHVELSDDLRGGGWQAYLYRSDDFLRFTARLMIDEMLMLHGGETRHRLVLARRLQK